MNISQAARACGLSAGTIRYYEDIELISAAPREANGYRCYDERALGELRFVHRARQVGFSVEECRQLVDLYRDQRRRSSHVRDLVMEKCRHIERRVEQLQAMQQVLTGLARRCNGDEGPECAILDALGRAD